MEHSGFLKLQQAETEAGPTVRPFKQQETAGRSELPSGTWTQDPHLKEETLPQVSHPVSQELTEKCGFLEPVEVAGYCPGGTEGWSLGS